ncbi:MAG TPA: hypothetical protein VIS96_16220 [Terrimicrobiaceae bacterium]
MERGINCYRTSSAGRLFDAAAVLITGRQSVRHEGQAAVELENLILDETYDSEAAFKVEITEDVSGTWVVNVRTLYHALFHAAVIDRQPPKQLSLA